MKPVKGWVVIDPDEKMISSTINWSKQNYSIKSFLRGRTDFYSSTVVMLWKAYYKRGYRCVKVTLRIDE